MVQFTGADGSNESIPNRSGSCSEAATGAQTTSVVEAVKRRGVLLSSDGPDHNVLKIKPPMVISMADAARVVAAIDEAVGEVLG